MLAPYPDRLRSSRSTSNANPPSTSPSPTSQHRLLGGLSSTRMRTNSLSSPSLSSHSDSPSTSSDHPPRTLRNPSRRPVLSPRPSTSSGVLETKHSPVAPILPISPLSGVVPPFADLIPRKRSIKRPSVSRKDSSTEPSSRISGATLVDSALKDSRFSTTDRAILEELKIGTAARESQFKMKGTDRHHAYHAREAPYPRNYERPVIDHDVWETAFIRQLSGSQIFHVLGMPPTKVLDLGCGTGYWILECANLWRNCEFVGLDLVPLQPDLSHLRSSDLGSRIRWVQANCLEGLPFPNDEFDFVHIKRIARGIPEDKWDFLLEEISRVMKPGAAIEMIEEDLYFPGQSLDPPLPQSSTTIPHITTPPISNHNSPNGESHIANDQRALSQFGSSATITAAATSQLIYSPSLPNTPGAATPSNLIRGTDTIYLHDDSDHILYSDSSRPAPGAPLNPRDHSLLEYIYTEMHAARFINLSPLSLLANALPLYFNNVRSHAPIMFMFPPSGLTGVKQHPSRPKDEKGTPEGKSRPPQPLHNDPGKTTSATLIGPRQILNHTQRYVFLDESAVAPGTMTARQKASSSTSHLPCNPGTPTQTSFPSISTPICSGPSLLSEEYLANDVPITEHDTDGARWLNTLPNQHLRFDLQSLNLHLSARVTEILACAEAMWEWVCEYQDAQRSAHGQQSHLHKEHSQIRNTHPGERGTYRFSTELVCMSRAEFDVLLTRFELDMRDCININSRITSTFHVPPPVLPPTNERKAFDNACEKWEEYQITQRERSKARLTVAPPKKGVDKAAPFDVRETASSREQRLSRTIRVFCAWKAT